MWFGESWGAPVCESDTHIATPVGQPCVECERDVHSGDQGFTMPFTHGSTTTIIAYHRICFLRTVIPCGMWSDEMKQDLPERWRRHLEEHHALGVQ